MLGDDGNKSLLGLKENPFIDFTSPITFYEGTKMVFLFPLAVLRILLGLMLFAAAILCISFDQFTGISMEPALIGLMRALLCVIGLSVETKGIENLRAAEAVDRNVVLIYNHVSIVDQFVLVSNCILGFITSVAYRNTPIVKQCLVYVDSIFLVKGTSGASQQIVDRLAGPKADTRFMIAVAPEGTLSNGRALLKFKSGAFVARVPVLPVILRYPYKHFCPAWTIDSPYLICYRFLTQFVNYAIVEYLPMVYCSAEEDGEAPAEFAERVRCIMGAALAVPLVELDVTDKVRLMKKYRMSLLRDSVDRID